MMARLHFIVSVAGVFEPFLLIFQSVSPMIHLLKEELANVLRLLLKRFLKSDALNGKSDAELLDVSLENRPIEQCDFGAKTQELVRQMKKDNNQKLALLQKDMLHFMKTSAKYLQDRLPLKNRFLNNVRCLQPAMRSTPESSQMITALATCLPQLCGDITFTDRVSNEWQLYQADINITSEWSTTDGDAVIAIDTYWARVLKLKDVCGQPKYPTITIVVKAALAVNHGQADVERGFSLNKLVVTESRVSLKQKTVVALRTVKDVVNRHDSVDKVKISRQLLTRHRSAHAAYVADLGAAAEAEKTITNEREVKAKADSEKQIGEKRKGDNACKQKDAERLIAEANDCLTGGCRIKKHL